MLTAQTAIYALTPQGAQLARKLVQPLEAALYLPEALAAEYSAYGFGSLTAQVQEVFARYRRHVFVTAAGIAVRCIAPLIESKHTDPAVVVVDQRGQFAISLISGHLGGANNLAREVASLIGGQAVITTATDTENLPSLDTLAQERNMAIHNPKAITLVNSALLADVRVDLFDPYNRLGLRGTEWARLFTYRSLPVAGELDDDTGPPMVVVTPRSLAGSMKRLILHPKVLHVGVGCRKGVGDQAIVDFIQHHLEEAGFSLSSLASLASVSLKANEEGILSAAAWLGVPVRFFSPDELAAMPVTEVSPKAQEVLGIDGVSETAALLSAGANALLHLPKQKGDGITMAMAEDVSEHA